MIAQGEQRLGQALMALLLLISLSTLGVAQVNHDHAYEEQTVADATAAPATIDVLVGQIQVAIAHATFSLHSENLDARLLHAHHVVNILQGADGPDFDAVWGNPGDGYGARLYAGDLVSTTAGEHHVWAENTAAYLRWADERAVAATQATTYDEAGEQIHRALAYLSAALGRRDDTGLLGAALALQGAGGDDVTITISHFSFGDGETLFIAAGTTVTWTNNDAAPHSVVADTFESPVLQTGESWSYTFESPGVYDYVCGLHPTMKHTIVVE